MMVNNVRNRNRLKTYKRPLRPNKITSYQAISPQPFQAITIYHFHSLLTAYIMALDSQERFTVTSSRDDPRI
jgi:hypothetical protein